MGLVYLCIFNFVLLAIWLFCIKLTTSYVDFFNFNFLSMLRVLFFSCKLAQTIFSLFRFVLFYYTYTRTSIAVFIYIFIAILFYFHTKRLDSCVNSLPLPLKQQDQVRNERQPNFSVESGSSVQDIDIEISVTELIDQINGLTTIWLQSTTHADRLISELPAIEYCKCFYARLIEFDETTEESDGEDKRKGCECGKNSEINNGLKSLYSKFHRECSICLEKYSYGNLIILLPCGHLFHKKCLYDWFTNSINYKCPVCRTSFYKFKKSI